MPAVSTCTSRGSRASSASSHEFIAEGRFRFQSSLDRSDEERANPWLLLEREQRDDGEATPTVRRSCR